MPPYPRQDWFKETPCWWAPTGSTEIDRRTFARAWVGKATTPKPNVKEYRDELLGWSGELSRRPWVRDAYTRDVAWLAGIDTPVDQPATWRDVSLLFCDCADGLARFSAQYAKIADGWKPTGLSARLTTSVREYARAVPPKVRAVMAAPVADDGDDVLESADAVSDFLEDPDAHVDRHRAVAEYAYAVVLVTKRDLFADERDLALVDAVIDRLAPGGVDLPDHPTPADEAAADTAILAELARHPAWAEHDHLGEAWRRARPVIARRIAAGRPPDTAWVLRTKLGDAEQDEIRASARRRNHETPYDPTTPPPREQPVTSPDDGTFERAHAALVPFPALALDGSSDCWEKQFALSLLAAGTLAGDWFGLAERIHDVWSDGRPDAAVSRDANAALAFVQFLLRHALGSVTGRDPADRYADVRRLLASDDADEGRTS